MVINTEQINEFVDIINEVGDLNKILLKGDILGNWDVVLTQSSYENGFYGVTLKNLKTKELLLVFRGTDFTQTNDVLTDFAIGLDFVSRQQKEALLLYGNSKNLGTVATLIGHSLGGGIAEFIGAIKGTKTYTFNGIGVKHLIDGVYKPKKPNCSNIENYICKLDLVGNLFEHCSNNSFYIEEPQSLMHSNNIGLIIRTFKALKNVISKFNRIADFINDFIYRQNIAAKKFAIPNIIQCLKEAHNVDNFRNLSPTNYSISNDLL